MKSLHGNAQRKIDLSSQRQVSNRNQVVINPEKDSKKVVKKNQLLTDKHHSKFSFDHKGDWRR